MTSSTKARQFAKRTLARLLDSGIRILPRRTPVPGVVRAFAQRCGIDIDFYLPRKIDPPIPGLRAPAAGDPIDLADLPPKLPIAGEPRCSIIILAFNKAEYTSLCLRSVLKEIDSAAVEIIVVDNASIDNTSEVLRKFGNRIDVIHNEDNLGFVDGCNVGAAAAKGRYLLFLNNDTVVLPGAIDTLLESVERDETIGVIGPMFLYPDGRIQEAGGIVWRDASAHHFGWGGSPRSRTYRLARSVDYVSGAALVIRRDLFERLEGFDHRYAPGYYEDVDICFGVRAMGYRVAYQPSARIVHFEGVSSGTDLSAGMKRFQVVNQQKFVEKWRQVLESHHLEPSPRNVAAAANWLRPKKVFLVFDERIPTPDRDAGSLRMLHILRSLSRIGRTIFVPLSGEAGSHYESELWELGLETEGVAFWMRLAGEEVVAAIFSRPSVGESLMSEVKAVFPNAQLIYDMVDAHFVRLEREQKLDGDISDGDIEAVKAIEIEAARKSDLVWAASPTDATALRRYLPEIRTAIIPTIHTLKARGKKSEDRSGMLFIGNMAHRPNRDGILHFLDEVLPRIREKLPLIELTIVGAGVDDEIASHADANTRVLGYVPDVQPLLDQARVFVAPLRFGAGVKGKVGEAMSCGLPVVTTTIGAEGLGLMHEKNVLIHDHPESFANAVFRLIADDSLWQEISDESYRHVIENLTPEVIRERIADSIEEVRCASVEN